VSTLDCLELARGRIRPGRAAQILDLSSGGALIETDWQLMPGTRVDLQLGSPIGQYRVAARILRSQVALLHRERVRYRGALRFEERISFPWE
jgi:PilZ domain